MGGEGLLVSLSTKTKVTRGMAVGRIQATTLEAIKLRFIIPGIWNVMEMGGMMTSALGSDLYIPGEEGLAFALKIKK